MKKKTKKLTLPDYIFAELKYRNMTVDNMIKYIHSDPQNLQHLNEILYNSRKLTKNDIHNIAVFFGTSDALWDGLNKLCQKGK